MVFTLFAFVPDPARELAGQNESQEVVDAIRSKYRLDQPYFPRLGYFLNDLSLISRHALKEGEPSFLDEKATRNVALYRGKESKLLLKTPYLGRSFLSNKHVSSIISEAVPGTFLLAISAISIALVLGIGLGILSAIRKDTWIDHLAIFVTSIGMSGPSFFMAILIAWVGGVLLYEHVPLPIWPVALVLIGFLLSRWKAIKNNWFMKALLVGTGIWVLLLFLDLSSWAYVILPGTGLSSTGSMYEIDVWTGKQLALQNLILPAITLGIRPLSVIVQLTRSSLLEVLNQNYIRTARAKGLSERTVIMKHALKNALNPVITAASGWFASMLAGAVFVEYVFGWKGLGFEIFQALEKNDLPVVIGAVLFIACLFVVINILVDILYGILDPRARINS